MVIRPLKESEIEKVSFILAQDFLDFEKERQFIRYKLSAMFKNHVKTPTYLVLEDKGEIKGVAGYGQASMNSHLYEIFSVAIAPHYQRQGFGTLLMKRVLEDIKSKKGEYTHAYCVLLTTTKPLFYSKKFGFKTIMRFREKKSCLMVLSFEK